MIKILDIYYKIPLLIDLIIVIAVWVINTIFPIFEFNISNNKLNAIGSSLIDTSVSLAGFILAALTIIVTFKSNIKAKGIDDAKNAFEMILASNNYKNIVKTFKNSIAELSFVFLSIYVIQTMDENISIDTYYKVIISAITLLVLSILRSLYLLFRILKLESN